MSQRDLTMETMHVARLQGTADTLLDMQTNVLSDLAVWVRRAAGARHLAERHPEIAALGEIRSWIGIISGTMRSLEQEISAAHRNIDATVGEQLAEVVAARQVPERAPLPDAQDWQTVEATIRDALAVAPCLRDAEIDLNDLAGSLADALCPEKGSQR